MEDRNHSIKKTLPLVSVIIPVYNAEAFLDECLCSVAAQTYENLEIIVIDDGSKDNSLSVARNFLRDKRFSVLTGDNFGAPYARNTGLAASKGEFVLFFDADDVLYPDAVQSMMDNLMSSSADLVIGAFDIIDEAGSKTGKMEACLPDGVYDIENEKTLTKIMCYAALPDVRLFRADLIKQNGILFDSVNIAQDVNFLFKYLSVCSRVSIVSKTFCSYRIVSNSISRKKNYNLFEIVDSIDMAEEYAVSKSVSPVFLRCLTMARAIQYQAQETKYADFPEKKDRIAVLSFFRKQYLRVLKEKQRLLSDAAKLFIYKKLITSTGKIIAMGRKDR